MQESTRKPDGLRSKITYFEPDKTFYESVKGVSLIDFPVADLPLSKSPPPKAIRMVPELVAGWHEHHAPLIEAAYTIKEGNIPFRSIFPGPYIPSLNGDMVCVGGTSYGVFEYILRNVKQRIPQMKNLLKNSHGFEYKSLYRPIIRKITEPEESWTYRNIPCPVVSGVNFPLPPIYEYEPEDEQRLNTVRQYIQLICRKFIEEHVGKGKRRTIQDVFRLISFIHSVEYLHIRNIPSQFTRSFHEVLTHFDLYAEPPKNPEAFLFEIEHALSYLLEIVRHPIICYGRYATFWVDVLKLPVELLIETELCDIQRVLREIRSFYTLGWSPITVHFDRKLAYCTDGTHRHYALLTIELLRRLVRAHHGKSIRSIDLNSALSFQTIRAFQSRYNKVGLSLRETLRVVNYLVNSDSVWPYLNDIEIQMKEALDDELSFVPVIYLPEWRARSVIKNLCDKGIALVGVPPVNIQIVGRSQGKKGIFIRGGYHGTDRQPMVWMNILEFQHI